MHTSMHLRLWQLCSQMHMPSRSIMRVILVARVTFLTCFPVFRGGYISSSYWLIISERVWLRNCQSWVEHISMGVCKVCQSHPVLSFTPRKQSYSPLHPTLPLPHLPPPPLSFDPPLQPRWWDDREREERVAREGGERKERDDSSSTSVEDWKRGKERSAVLRSSFSPWGAEGGVNCMDTLFRGRSCFCLHPV